MTNSQVILELVAHFWLWWYGEFFREYLHKLVSMLSQVWWKTTFGVQLQYFFIPVYQNYTLTGRAFSFVFRSTLILLLAPLVVICLFLALFATIIYLVLPLTPLIKIWLALATN